MAYVSRPKKSSYRTEKEKQDRSYKERQKVYQSREWKMLRTHQQINNPLCKVCELEGRITPSEDIHHLQSFTTSANNGTQINYDLALDPRNLLSLCDKCHTRIHHGNLKGCKSIEDIIQYLKAQGTYNPIQKSLLKGQNQMGNGENG